MNPRMATLLLVTLALASAGCGDDSEDGEQASSEPATAAVAETAPAETTIPEGAEAPEGAETPPGSEAGEASPEAPAEGPEGSKLPDFEEQAVTAAFENYIRQIDARDGAAVCAAFAARGLPTGELPVDRGACAASVEASLGTKPKGGAPAWRSTEIVDVEAVSVGEGQARVTATVVHEFGDRKYTSVEEDVTYFRQVGERWAVVKPSATLYRAVGYPEPPLRAYTPPR